MNFKALFFPVFLLLILSCNNNAHNTPPPAKDTVKVKSQRVDSSREGLEFPKKMNVVRKNAYDTFAVRIKDSIYYCTYKGEIFSADTAGHHHGTVLNLGSEYLIDEVYLSPMKDGRFFVVWQETNHLGLSSNYAVYSRGQSKPDWKHSERAPSPGQPVISDDAIYISSLGMVGKYHLSTGAEYWAHDSLFDQLKLSYKRFERPLIYNAVVCFYDLPIKGKKPKGDSIWIDDNSGKIIPRPRSK